MDCPKCSKELEINGAGLIWHLKNVHNMGTDDMISLAFDKIKELEDNKEVKELVDRISSILPSV
jgi:hypothetical protein